MSPEKSKSSLVAAVSPNKDQKKREMGRKKKRSLESEELDENCAEADDVRDVSHNKAAPVDHALEGGRCSDTPDIWEILSLSCPLPAPLSPLPPDELVINPILNIYIKCLLKTCPAQACRLGYRGLLFSFQTFYHTLFVSGRDGGGPES